MTSCLVEIHEPDESLVINTNKLITTSRNRYRDTGKLSLSLTATRHQMQELALTPNGGSGDTKVKTLAQLFEFGSIQNIKAIQATETTKTSNTLQTPTNCIEEPFPEVNGTDAKDVEWKQNLILPTNSISTTSLKNIGATPKVDLPSLKGASSFTSLTEKITVVQRCTSNKKVLKTEFPNEYRFQRKQKKWELVVKHFNIEKEKITQSPVEKKEDDLVKMNQGIRKMHEKRELACIMLALMVEAELPPRFYEMLWESESIRAILRKLVKTLKSKDCILDLFKDEEENEIVEKHNDGLCNKPFGGVDVWVVRRSHFGIGNNRRRNDTNNDLMFCKLVFGE